MLWQGRDTVVDTTRLYVATLTDIINDHEQQLNTLTADIDTLRAVIITQDVAIAALRSDLEQLTAAERPDR